MLDAARRNGPISYAVIALLLGAGLRRAELHDASWSDLFDDGAGRIGLRVIGKGGKSRVVKVRQDLWRFLRAWRRSRGLPDEPDPSDTSPLVIGRDGTRLSIRAIHDRIKVASRAAGIRKPVSAHWLRHSFATIALQGGASIAQVRDALGHASLSTTSIYIHQALGLEDGAPDHLPLQLGGMQ